MQFPADLIKLKRRRDLKIVLERLMKDPDFQYFMKWTLKECGVTRPKFLRDPYEIAYNEGKRHFAMGILDLIAGDGPQDLINKLEQEKNDSNQ